MMQFTKNLSRLTILFWAGLALACAAKPDANKPLELVLSKDMPEKALPYKWDARAPNVIYIINHAWGNTVYDLHIFEDLLVPAKDWPAKHFFNNRRLNEKLFEWKRQGDAYAFHIRQDELVNYEMSGTVRTEGNQIRVEGRITNHSPFHWTKDSCGALMCFRCRLNPEFRDLEGKRVMLFKTGQTEPHSVFELQGNKVKYFNFQRPTEPQMFEPRIIKWNQSLTRAAVMETDPCISLGGNREDSTSCIHANVALSAKSGETSTFKTTITLMEKEQALAVK